MGFSSIRLYKWYILQVFFFLSSFVWKETAFPKLR